MCLRVEIFKMSTVYNLNHFSTLFFCQVMKELKNNFIIEIVFPALYIQKLILDSYTVMNVQVLQVVKFSKRFLFLCLLLKLLLGSFDLGL